MFLLYGLYGAADNFGVEFPHQADSFQKALLMGAVFLIDFVPFEKTCNQKNVAHRPLDDDTSRCLLSILCFQINI
jgi:hypothetical protein